MNGRLTSLKEAVVVLASDAAAQVEHLRRLGLPQGIDELVLEYDAISAAADDMYQRGELDKNQYDAVKQLNDVLSKMSGKADASLWTAEALTATSEWKEVRNRAKKCFRLLDQNSQGPTSQ